MEHHARVPSRRVLVDQRVRVRLPSDDHPQLVPTSLGLLILQLVELLQWYEPCLPSFAHRMEVHRLIFERPRLEGAIDVPTRPAHIRAALLLVVRHAENVRVRTLRMLVESALHHAQLPGDLHLSGSADLPLPLEDEDTVLVHVLFELPDHVVGQRVITLQDNSTHLAAKVRQDRCDLVQSPGLLHAAGAHREVAALAVPSGSTGHPTHGSPRPPRSPPRRQHNRAQRRQRAS
mmetsp:Transcript_85309/g.217369  ORF Transcript_85309/g.217369 Transcript_85309/m.217369 type:complete len:233 (+) Transcript_85309:423-1121(+)